MDKTKNKNTILIISLAVCLILLALTFRETIYDNKIKQSIVEIPRITVPLKSSSDGSSHTLLADLYIDIPKEYKKNISVDELQNTISELLKTIDYDLVSTKYGIAEVRNIVKKELSQKYPDIKIDNIYAKNFVTDIMLSSSKKTISIDDKLKSFRVK